VRLWRRKPNPDDTFILDKPVPVVQEASTSSEPIVTVTPPLLDPPRSDDPRLAAMKAYDEAILAHKEQIKAL